MRKNMKAIFIVSILFIICVGLFGLVSGNSKNKRSNINYNKIIEEHAEKTIDESTNQEVVAENADVGQSKQAQTGMQEKVVEEQTPDVESKKEAQNSEELQNQPMAAKGADTNATIPKEKSEKDQYLERLNSIVTYYDDIWNKSGDYSMYDMKELKNQEYKKWDDELNTIYQLIKKKMSEKDFILLRDEEREWITKRDEQATLEASKYAGGSMEGLEYMSVMTDVTKERTYELVDIYFQE